MAARTFTAYIEYDDESQLYVGSVPGIPGAHTQGASLDELRANSREVLELCVEELGDEAEDILHFVGVQQIEVADTPRHAIQRAQAILLIDARR